MATAEEVHHAQPGPDDRVVVIGVDNSPSADYAFDWYLKNVRKPNDFAILVNSPELGESLHSSWNGSMYVFDQRVLSKVLQDEEEKIKNNLKSYKTKMQEIGLKGVVKAVGGNSPGFVICQVAEEATARLIVVGCRGHGVLRRKLMGSVSDYVMHHSHVPVIVCRHLDTEKHHHHFDFFHRHRSGSGSKHLKEHKDHKEHKESKEEHK